MEEEFDGIEQKIRVIIGGILKVKDTEIKKESTIADFGGDSLAALRIISALEQEFDISFTDEEAFELYSFSGAIEVVKKHIKDL